MLCDRNAELVVGPVRLSTGTDGVLHLVAPGHACSWESPVNIAEPARDTYEALRSEVDSDDELWSILDGARVQGLRTLKTIRVVPEGTRPSNDGWNEDWIRTLSWDLGIETLPELLRLLGAEGSDLAGQKAAVEQFTQLPAWTPAPESLKRDVAEFLEQ